MRIVKMPLFKREKKEGNKKLSSKMGCVYKDYSQYPDQKTDSYPTSSKNFSSAQQHLLPGKIKYFKITVETRVEKSRNFG